MGVASDLYWVVCGDDALLGAFAEVGEEGGVKGTILEWVVGVGRKANQILGCWKDIRGFGIG